MLFDTQDNAALQFIFLILLIGSTIYLFIQSSQAKKREPPRKLVTVVKCQSTGQESKREFKEEDYVGKVTGKCGEEGVEVIKAIYAEKPEETR